MRLGTDVLDEKALKWCPKSSQRCSMGMRSGLGQWSSSTPSNHVSMDLALWKIKQSSQNCCQKVAYKGFAQSYSSIRLRDVIHHSSLLQRIWFCSPVAVFWGPVAVLWGPVVVLLSPVTFLQSPVAVLWSPVMVLQRCWFTPLQPKHKKPISWSLWCTVLVLMMVLSEAVWMSVWSDAILMRSSHEQLIKSPLKVYRDKGLFGFADFVYYS